MNLISQLFESKVSHNIPESIRKRSIGTKNFLICITPRSGSTLLARLLQNTKVLGNPDEFFNPDSMVGVLERLPCNSLIEYVDAVRREQSSENGVFGVQMSFYHLSFMLELLTIEQIFDKMPIMFYLTRENIVLQAISLYLSVESGYFHSYQEGKSGLVNKFKSVKYDAEKIKKWCNHIYAQEKGFEEFFPTVNIEPIRLHYEEFIKNQETTVKLFCNVLNVPCSTPFLQDGALKKIGTGRNTTWEKKFREENSLFINSLTEKRTALLTQGN